ncbi:glycoside hydrolase superfamily [Syncephalis plumigaleata]|nr:glycoside hydrolase superfamily [Syncephalis plumigaleata]
MHYSYILKLLLVLLFPVLALQNELESNTAAVTTLQKRASGSGIVVGYYTDWNSQQLPPNNKLTHINYAFALIDTRTYAPTIQTTSLLADLVKNAHKHNVRVAISIGGWSGSAPFSAIAADANKRSKFVQQTRDFVAKNNLDGVDIDWEYPGRETNGVAGRKDDSNNLLALLRELRKQLPKDKYISAAVRPMKDVSAFAGPLSFVQVMAYDVYGSWSSTTGPNAPFNPAKGGTEPPTSFTTAAKAWADAKFPREKIVMGLAFYGRSAVAAGPLKPSSMYGPQNKNVAQSAGADGSGGSGGSGGVWTWKDLRAKQILASTSSANKGAGWQQLAVKINYVRKNNYGGVMIWALNQDNGELLSLVAAGNSGRLRAMEASAALPSNSRLLLDRTSSSFLGFTIALFASIVYLF